MQQLWGGFSKTQKVLSLLTEYHKVNSFTSIYRNTHEFIMEDPCVWVHSYPITFCDSETIQDHHLHTFGNIVSNFEEPGKLERGQKSTSTTHTQTISSHHQTLLNPWRKQNKGLFSYLPLFMQVPTFAFTSLLLGFGLAKRAPKYLSNSKLLLERGKGCEIEEGSLKLFFHTAKLSNN